MACGVTKPLTSPITGSDADAACDATAACCPHASLGVWVFKEVTGAAIPIPNAEVKVPSLGIKTTDANGWAVWEKIKPGTYDAEARKDAHIPDPGKKSGVNVPPNQTTTTEIKLALIELHMHLDADRDGNPDGDRTGLDKWEWGKGKKGAIILCNNDDDEQVVVSTDNEDDEVNKGNDKDEVAPLVFRRTGPVPPPSWKAFLEIDPRDQDKIRIFDSRMAGAKEIIGPKTHIYQFPDLSFTEKEFGMEALKYADRSFDGEIMLFFTVDMGGGKSYTEKGKVRVAPWMMPNHLDKAERVYVVDAGRYNDEFRKKLKQHVTAARCSLKEIPEGDIWMQDCMEFGYSNLPGHGFRSVMRAQRPRPLNTFPKTLVAADLGYHEQGNAASMIPAENPDTGVMDPASKESTLNSTGNLECSPPVTSRAGKKYPWGRIYYGGTSRPGTHEMDADIKAFLAKQVVQEPVDIDTSWLAVAHVDEIISFVPSKGPKGFKLLLASPNLAYDILKRNKDKHPTAKLLIGRRFPEIAGDFNVEVTIKDFLDIGMTFLDPRFTNTYLENYNKDKQEKLNKSIRRDKLEKELGVDASDIIEVPVIFADIMFPPFADALTAGMVNMLVINNHCIFPKPFGPVVGKIDLFQDDLEKKLKAEGLIPLEIDDWDKYHVKMGEVHCGTNTLRTPVLAKWWEFEP